MTLNTNPKEKPEYYTALPLSFKFEYLAEKMNKWMDGDILKLVTYWSLLIELPYGEAPEALLPIYKQAKDRIKKELLL